MLDPTDTNVAEPHGGPALLAEARRELSAVRSSRYQHVTDVREESGVFDYDCSGFLDYALGAVLPTCLAALPRPPAKRPLAADFERHFREIAGDPAPTKPWRAVPAVADLAAGDVVAWLATEKDTTHDTGHVMVVTDAPEPDPDHPDRWLVPVADSTMSPHAHDSRDEGQTGLGTGTIGLVVDGAGAPVAFCWRGELSSVPTYTPIALGRPLGPPPAAPPS